MGLGPSKVRSFGARYVNTSGYVTLGDVIIINREYYLVVDRRSPGTVSGVKITTDVLSGHFPPDETSVVIFTPLKPFNRCMTKDWNERHMELCNLFKDIPLP